MCVRGDEGEGGEPLSAMAVVCLCLPIYLLSLWACPSPSLGESVCVCGIASNIHSDDFHPIFKVLVVP